MLLKDTRTNDNVKVYVGQFGTLCKQRSPMTITIDALVAGNTNMQTLLLFELNKPYPSNSSMVFRYHFSGKVYNALLVDDDHECEMADPATLPSIKTADPITLPCMPAAKSVATVGHKCSKCNLDCPDAMHDNPNTFVCSGCKLLKKMWG